ncbi:hypothetical protein CHU98_g7419 [Xylaria longipes]|nr:hypothetical protein CHU98_g7419 [Xylaria longipes]
MTTHGASHFHPISDPIPILPRNASSEATSCTSTWGTISTRSYMEYLNDDDCAIIDDSDEEEFGPPNSRDPLTFPRSPPKLTPSLSLLGLMLANVKEMAKRPRHSTSSREDSSNNNSDYDSDVLEMRSSRRRRVRRRQNTAPCSSPEDETPHFHPEVMERGNVAVEEGNVQVDDNIDDDEDNPEVDEDSVEVDEASVNVDEGNVDPREDNSFWVDFIDQHGGYHAHGW